MRDAPAKPTLDIAHVYLVARADLPAPHLSVQLAHAAIAATHAYGEDAAQVPHPNLVVCTVADEAELAGLFERLKGQGVPCCAWYEEAMRNSLTAIATGPLRGVQRKPLRKLPLLR